MGHRPAIARGFSLLELIVVLAVLAIGLAVVTPSVNRGTEGLRTRAEVASFAATLRHAREQAINTQHPRRVVVDRDAHRVSIVGAGAARPAEHATAGRPGDHGTAGETKEREMTETRAFSSRLVVEALQSPEVVFDARGGASGGDFKLSSGDIVYRVTVDRLTGRVRSVRE